MIASGQNIETKIRNHPFLASMHPEHLKIICECAKPKTFESGDVLFNEGEPADSMFLIQSGRVRLQTRNPRGEEMIVETLADGDVVGWSWLVPPFSWRFCARVIAPTECIVINGAHLLVTAEENPEFGYALMHRVAQLMAHRMEQLRQHLFDEHEQNTAPPYSDSGRL